MLKDRTNINAGRRRLQEIREQRGPSALDTIKNSRTTVTINIAIEVLSGILFMTGLVIAVKFLNLRRAFMEAIHYKMMLWSIIAIGAGWSVWLLIRMRSNVQRLFELRALADEHAGDKES